MNAFTLKTPTIRVPGLLSDEALQEQLKVQKQNFNGGATQAPTAALEMADRVQSEFFDAPVRNTLRLAAPLAGPMAPALQLASSVAMPNMEQPVDAQQRAVDVRSDILSNDTMSGPMSYILGGPIGFAAREGGVLDELGTLTPEQSEQERQRREVEAGEYEAGVKRTAETRQKLRNLTQEEATAMGLPIQPGIDATTEDEQRQMLEQQDVDRVKRAEESTADAKVTAPTTTWWLNSIRSFYTGQNAMYTGIGKGAAIGLWELPGELAGIRESGRSDMRAWFDTVDETMKKILPTDVAQAEDFVTQLSQGAGSMVGFMVGGFLAHQIGLPSNVATTIIGATSGGSQQYEDAERFGATGVQRFLSFVAGAGLGMTEAIPINRALMRLETATGGAVSRGLQSTATASLQEFIQELGQNLGQDVVAKAIYDENRVLDWKGYLEAGAVGGILGAMGGGAAETLGRSGFGRKPQLTEQAAPVETSVDEQAAFLNGFMVKTQEAFDQITAEPATPTDADAAAVALPAEVAVEEGAAASALPPVEGIVSAEQEQNPSPAEAVLELEGEELATLASRAPKSEAFETWFGDSKVRTPEGEPLIAYHGGSDGVFKDGAVFFAASPELASEHATRSGWRKRVSRSVVPAYLSIQNPLVVDFKDKQSFADLRLTTVSGKKESIRSPELSRLTIQESAITKARKGGFDGVVFKNWKDIGKAGDIYVVLEPTQIKSVNNAGNFDPADPDILAATSSTRGGYTGEANRPATGVAGQTDPASDNVNLRLIANNFSKLLGLTVRQGRMTLKGADVMGQYSTGSGVIRLRTPNDLSTLVHEGGHALERNADGPLRKFTKDNEALLKIAARRLYGGDTSKMSDATLVAEGFAEFFRIYTLNKRFAEVNYSHLDTAFTAMLDQHNPQLRDGLRLIGDQYAAWLQLPSSQLVRNMIVSGKETTGINGAIAEAREQGLGNWFREWVNGIFTSAINRNNDLNNLVSDILNVAEANRNAPLDLKRADDPRVLIRMATNAGNRAMVQLTDGVMPYRSTDPTTPGLRAVLLRYHGQKADSNLSAIDPVRQQDFAAYVVALRGIDEFARFSQGLIERPPLAATLGDLNTTVTELEAKYGTDFQEAAQMIHEYSMGLWEKGYQAGLIDDKTYQDGLSRTFYVPLQRDMSDKEITQSGISASAARQGRSIVKRFRGSDRDVIDPMDALMQKTFALEKVIAENEVKKALAKLADQAGQAGALVERVPAHRLLGEQFSIQEVARQITKDPTLSQTDAQDLLTLLETAIDEGNRIALFRSQQATAAGENIVFFWEKGKLAAIQIKDGDVGTDIINTLNAVGTETVPLLVDLIAYPSTFFRAAVTSWPDFLLVNFIRDQMSAFVLTEGYKPFVTGMRGVGDEIRQGDWARQYNAAMGTMGGMNTSTLHSARVNRDIAALRKKGYVARVFGEDGMTGKIKGLARITELTETGTRLGIYRTAYERAKADGLTDWEASVEASYISTDYIDFGLHGNRMMAWRRLVPFLNAQLQGLYKMMRTLGADEVRQRKGLRFAVAAFFKDTNGLQLSRAERQAVRVGRKAWLKMASLGIIGAAIQAVFEDDPDYQDASEYLRTTGWVVPIGNGEIFYIPKPFELAMVSNIVERAFEHASGDKEAKWRMMRGMAMNLVPPTNPPAIQAIVEQMGNYDYFSSREIVPDYMRALEPELQYNHYTTEFAKSVGSAFGWSPMRIDHALSALGASAYRDLSQMYNMTDPSRPESDRTEWPITRRFVRDARRGAASAQDFWKFASTVDGSLRRAELTYKNYIESGREAAAESYLSELDPDEQAYALLNTHFKADYKRLNPTYRARQMTTIVSALRRELYSDLGVENSGPGGELDPFMLSAKEKADVDTLMSEYARREVRNSLVFMKAPGWANKKPLPTEPTIEMLRATAPVIAEEFERRVKKAKVYDAATIQEYWPEVRDRLLSDRDEAFLKDILTVAKVMR